VTRGTRNKCNIDEKGVMQSLRKEAVVKWIGPYWPRFDHTWKFISALYLIKHHPKKTYKGMEV
jgi:hypothetical protein